MAKDDKTRSFNGLGTFSFVVQETGAKNIKGKVTLPTQSEGSPTPSQVIITVNVNGGAAIYTGTAAAEGFESGAYVNAGDTFNVILSSSLPTDQANLAVKSTISLY